MNVLEGSRNPLAPTNLLENLHYFELTSDAADEPASFTKPSDSNYPAVMSAVYGANGIMDCESSYIKDADPAYPSLRRANDNARQFVETTVGPTSGGDIFLVRDTKSDDNERNVLGSCTAVFGHIATKACEDADGSIRDLFVTSHLIHEQAHSTAIPTRKVTVVAHITSDESGYSDYAMHSSHSFGMQKVKFTHDKLTGELSSEVKNFFLEEAFAEETAARYRAQRYVNPDTLDTLVCSDGVDRPLPRRYLVRDEDDLRKVINYSSSAYPAYLVARLSEYAGVDLYDLMVLSRDPEYEVEAKREIVQVIESVQKGLYRRLREMPYPKLNAEFFALYDDVIGLINRKEKLEEAA